MTAVARPPEVPDRCPFKIVSSPISPSRCAAVMGCVAMSCGWSRVRPTTSRRSRASHSPTTSSSSVLSREVKTRRESVEAFRAGGREDLATKEEAEIAILGEYLPQPLTEDEIAELIREGIAATEASSARDMGKVMGWLAPWTRGRADGKHVSELVVQALAEADLAAHDVGTH